MLRLDALGDLVLTTPVFRELKRNYPQSRVTVAIQRNYVPLLETNPHVDEVLALPARKNYRSEAAKRLDALRCALTFYWRQLRGRRFDVVLSPRWDVDEQLATMLCLLVDARARVGYTQRTSAGKRRFNRGFGAAFEQCLPPGPLQHEVLRNLGPLKAIGGVVSNDRLEIALTSCDRHYALAMLREVAPDRVRLALGIGAQAEGRRWPLESYASVVANLCEYFPVQPIITSAPAERADALRLAAMLPVQPIIDCSAEIRHTCALLERCDVFLGNDSGAAHLAAAMECPTIVVCRHPRAGDPGHPNSPLRFAPYCRHSVVLQPEVGLDQCSSHCLRKEPHCIEAVSVRQAIDAVMRVLERQVQRKSLVAAGV